MHQWLSDMLEKHLQSEHWVWGYDVACRDPVSRQQGDEHAEAGDSEKDVEQPGQQLEGVRRPAPAVGPRAEWHVGSLRAILAHRRRAVWVPTAHVHPAHTFITTHCVQFLFSAWSSSHSWTLLVIELQRKHQRDILQALFTPAGITCPGSDSISSHLLVSPVLTLSVSSYDRITRDRWWQQVWTVLWCDTQGLVWDHVTK